MRKSLPQNPNLSYLKKEAKALKQSTEKKDYSVSYRIAEHLTSYKMGAPLSLTDAQFVIAREYGFTSWPQLKASLLGQEQRSSDTKNERPLSERVNFTCGDMASSALKHCGVEGQRLPWKDIFCIGPLPATDDYKTFLLERAKFIKDWTQLEGLPAPEKMAQQELRLLQDTLSANAIVFWIWPHLSNQLLLLFLIDWYKTNDYQGELLWVDASEKTAQIDTDNVGLLINSETCLSTMQLAHASRVWKALRRHTPEELISILKENNTCFPHLNDALWRYVEELPDSSTGLSLQQHNVLESIQSGCKRPHSIYKYVHRHEKYYIAGDWSLWAVIAEMINTAHPLIETVDGRAFFYPPTTMSEDFDKQTLALTKLGKQVLNAEISNLNLNGRNRHWGALEFSGEKYWQYDKRFRRVVFAQAT
jgi:hypothetical protein